MIDKYIEEIKEYIYKELPYTKVVTIISNDGLVLKVIVLWTKRGKQDGRSACIPIEEIMWYDILIDDLITETKKSMEA